MTTEILILLSMIFLHTIADYNLQGWLASAKQKSWWEKNSPDELYRNDWAAALLMHGFVWSFCMMIVPVLRLWRSGSLGWIALIVFIANIVAHFIVDDLKANRHRISLIADQLCHMAQIVLTWLILCAMT